MKLISTIFLSIYNDRKRLLIFILFFSFLVSSIFLLFLRNIGPSEHRLPGTDYSTIYKPLAESILKGEGTTIEGEFITSVPPGYPIILSAVFFLSDITGIGELEMIILFNVFLIALTCIFLFLIAESVFNKKIALISSLLWMSYPFNLWFTKNPNTEILFIFLLYIGIWLYILSLKKKRLGFIFIAGVVLGFTSLIRPISLFLPFLLAFLVLFLLKNIPQKIKLLFILILLLGSIIIVLPWEAYVLFKTGNLILLSSSGAGAIQGGLMFAVRSGVTDKQFNIPGDVIALMERVKSEDLNNVADIFNFLLKETIDNPFSLLKLIFIKIIRSWYATSSMWYEGKILAIQIIYLIPSLLGLVWAIKLYRRNLGHIILLLGIIFYFWAMTVIAHSLLRYMIPAMGLVLIFLAVLINSIIYAEIFRDH